ncbi:MAG: 4-(cytidine 5'-diphospho)-2-C-methyl-D-erythritol kinase [Sphingobium sp.]|nr:4-(cytidine 5'-diphospho)-2-C-methyl-D-erythritol kinase [Sphingobium sp.]
MPLPDAAPAAADGIALTETAYAKVNLALHVRGRRDDGYHELESLFVFAEDGDRLEAARRDDGTLRLTLGGPFGTVLDNGADNLVLRAAHALRDRFGRGGEGARIYLDKRLPVASGIGGGSADAAAALRLLCRLWDLAPDAPALAELALDLGSDVPACLASVTQMVGGRGEHLGACAVPGLAGRPMLLVNPGVPVSTGAIFRAWDGIDRGALAAVDLEALGAARNDLQAPAVALAPVIAQALELLEAQRGAGLTRMSGSGATCFALFDRAADCQAAATAIAGARAGWWTMATRIRDI